MKEQWKEIHNFEGLYEVSSLGHVRSLDRMVLRRPGLATFDSVYTYIGQPLRIHVDKYGNCRVYLSANGRKYTRSVSQLVAEHFFEKPVKGRKIEHIDGDNTNCRLENLRYKKHGSKDNKKSYP